MTFVASCIISPLLKALVTSCLQLEGKTRVDGQGLFALRVTLFLDWACGLTAGRFL